MQNAHQKTIITDYGVYGSILFSNYYASPLHKSQGKRRARHSQDGTRTAQATKKHCKGKVSRPKADLCKILVMADALSPHFTTVKDTASWNGHSDVFHNLFHDVSCLQGLQGWRKFRKSSIFRPAGHACKNNSSHACAVHVGAKGTNITCKIAPAPACIFGMQWHGPGNARDGLACGITRGQSGCEWTGNPGLTCIHQRCGGVFFCLLDLKDCQM